jgi:hypothetical protein
LTSDNTEYLPKGNAECVALFYCKHRPASGFKFKKISAIVDDFRLIFAYAVFMFQGPPSKFAFVIRCKKCGENIPAPVETLPASWIAAKCPLCGEHRRYLPTEIFQGRLSYALIRRPMRSAQGGAR